MTDLVNLQVRDPFADDLGDAQGWFVRHRWHICSIITTGGKAAGNVHIRVQQRNGRKCITTVQGLNKELDLKLILKVFSLQSMVSGFLFVQEIKKNFCCNGSIVQDAELGTIIQLQGDQRDNISKFLTSEGLCDKV